MIRIGNLDLGHLIDTLNYLATPTPKSSRFLMTFSWLDVGLPHVLVLTFHLVNLLGWMGKWDHSRYLTTLPLKIRVN